MRTKALFLQNGFLSLLVVILGLALFVVIFLSFALLFVGKSSKARQTASQPQVAVSQNIPPTPAYNELVSKARSKGTIPIIVGLKVDFHPEGELPNLQAVEKQRMAIAKAQDTLLNKLSPYKVTSIKKLKYIPYLAVTVDAAGLSYLSSSPDITHIEEDLTLSPK